MDNKKFVTKLGALQTAVNQNQIQIKEEKISERIQQKDYTVWQPDPTEISNRLGWLDLPETMQPDLERIDAFVNTVKDQGFTHALLLGMGGSSLAPELFAKTFVGERGLQLAIVDTTDPDAILALKNQFPLQKTLFIVATKSGSTVETLSAFKYFYNQLALEMKLENPGMHFVAITDPGSKLERLADEFNFRALFLNDPNIGGRYSALSHFGLVPAALVGVDVAELLLRAAGEALSDQAEKLGVILGTMAKHGRDKVTLITSPEIASFGDWVEQLIAESTGKEGKGILPVVGETLQAADVYGDDRLFVYLHLPHSTQAAAGLAELKEAGQPAVDIGLNDLYDLGEQFMLWEMATAVAGHILAIHPFNQPNVEAAKVLAREMMSEYHDTGQLPEGESAELSSGALKQFLDQIKPGDYVALQAFVQPTAAIDNALQALRTKIQKSYKVATTVGYGPRFLHSTGQLHKGDGGNGLFIQFTSDSLNDVDIPDEAGQPESSMTFGVLIKAQALGDGQALQDENRRFIRFHLGRDLVDGLRKLNE